MSESTKAVFLSYASQDVEAALRLCTALRAAGVEVWFDQEELVGGDAWDQKIRKQIRECALFVPIISANTQARREGYFRLEWRLADQRTHMMGRSAAFLVPVSIDGTREEGADVPDSDEQEKLFRAAVELDPKFAEAWGELAYVHADKFNKQFDRTPARLALADAAITRALLLAPDSVEVVRLAGNYAFYGYYDYAKATEQFLKVIRLQPNNSEGIFWLASVQRRQGRWREALTTMRRAVELDPANARYASQLGNVFSVGRRWEESLAMARRVVSLVPADSPARLMWMRAVFSATGSRREVDEWIAQLTPAQRESPSTRSMLKTWARLTGDYAEWKRLDILSADEAHDWEEALNAALLMAAQGEAAEARTRLKSFPTDLRAELERQPANSRMWAGLSVMEALLGQKEDALRDAQKAVEIMPRTLDALEGAFTLRSLAVVYAWTGERGRAVAELSQLLESPLSFGSVHFIRTDPAFFPLRGDPSFEALLNDPKNNAPLF